MARTKSRSSLRNTIMNSNRVRKFRTMKRMMEGRHDDVHVEDIDETIFHQSQNTDTSSDSSKFDFENNTNIRNLLCAWVNCHGITTRAVNDLLRILRSAGLNLFAQNSCVTLLNSWMSQSK